MITIDDGLELRSEDRPQTVTFLGSAAAGFQKSTCVSVDGAD